MEAVRLGTYILDEAGEPLPCIGLADWSRMFEDPRRVVAQTVVGQLTVSTVFLGLDHGWGEGPPVLWETMIFDTHWRVAGDDYQERYTSRAAALEGHRRAVIFAHGAVPETKLLLAWHP